MVSLPFENNTFFRTGPDNDTANVLNIQPVIPFNLGDWNVITRTIIPVIYLPSVTDSLPDLPNADTSGDNFGLGDIKFFGLLLAGLQRHFYLGHRAIAHVAHGHQRSSRHPKMERRAGGGCSGDGEAVGRGHPRAPALVVAGKDDRDDVSQTLVQPFVNYNMADGWYLVSSPIITVNWEADRDNAAVVPVGGGVGRVFTVGGPGPQRAGAGIL